MNICIDSILKNKLLEDGINSEVFDNILSVSEKQLMLEQFENFASNWYICNDKDITSYKNISIGAAIHDDVLTFFSLLYHLIFIIEKNNYERSQIIFYQSVSCLLPYNIVEILMDLGIQIKTTNHRYPFPCYRKAYEENGASRKSYSGIVYRNITNIGFVSTLRPRLRNSLRKAVTNLILTFSVSGKEILLIRPMRRLCNLLKNYVEEINNVNRVHFCLEIPESNLSGIDSRLYNMNPLYLFSQMRRNYKKGLMYKQSDHIYSGYLKSLISSNYIKSTKSKFRENQDDILCHLKINKKEISAAFFDEFRDFYFNHLGQFLKQIDLNYQEIRKVRRSCYLTEYVNPFKLQVYAKSNYTVFILQVSRFLNNQYFPRDLLDRVNENVFILVSSHFERRRMIEQGFTEASIIKISESYFTNGGEKSTSINTTESGKDYLTGKTVLVTTPPLAVLWTYRMLLGSTFFMNYINDIIVALESVSVSRVILRPNRGGDKIINGVGFRLNDLYDQIIPDSSELKLDLIFRDPNQNISINDDLKESDLVIGTTSAVAIDTALAGLDYLVYDDSTFPYPETLNLSIFSEDGPIQKFSNKNHLIEYLKSYVPGYGRELLNYIKPYSVEESDTYHLDSPTDINKLIDDYSAG